MGFNEFLGNERIVTALRGMLRRDRAPGALLFTGPRGIGKYTLARMFAQAANCERMRDDFCGECESCKRMLPLGDPAALLAAGLTERGESADAAMVERMPLIIEPHPDVWLLVPDPVRRLAPVARPMIRVGQLRAVQRAAYFKPQGRRKARRSSCWRLLPTPCCKPSVRAACNSISRPSRWGKSKCFSANALKPRRRNANSRRNFPAAARAWRSR